MKKTLLSLSLILSLTPHWVSSFEGERFLQSEQAVKEATYGHIDGKGLKALIDTHTSFILLDARGDQWHDGNKIPGALLASYQNTSEELESMIVDKDSLVIVYCFSFTCPLSRRLADKLVESGFANVIEYPAGLKEWRDIANYPVETIE